MLVLTRKLGESIQIGEEIRVSVVRLSRGGVRLGITAPPRLAITRVQTNGPALEEQPTDEAPAEDLI